VKASLPPLATAAQTPAAVRFFLPVTALAVVFGLGSAQAADQTWTNSASDSLWNNSSANWSGDTWTAGNNALFGSTGAGAITVSGTQSVGNMTFSAAGYSLTGGTLSFANTAASNTINIGASNMTISSGLSAAFASSGGSLIKSGSGKLTLNGTISLTAASGGIGLFDFSAGTTEITGGTIDSTDVRMRTSISNGLTISGGTVNLGGTNANRGLQVNGAGSIAVSGGTVNTSAMSIGFGSTGTLNLSGGEIAMTGGGLITLGNTAAGTLNLTGGTLSIHKISRSGGASVTTSTLNWNGGTIKALSNQTTTGLFTVSGSGNMQVNVLAGGALIDSNGFDVKISNDLSGVGGLSKSGSGKLTLSGASSYSGITSVTAGTLAIESTGSIASSSQIIAGANTTLDVSAVAFTLGVSAAQTLSGTGTITGNMTVGSQGTLAIGNSAGTMTFNNHLGLNNGSISNFEINGFTLGNYDLALAATAETQTVSFNGGTLNLLFQSGFNTSGTLKIFDFDAYNGDGFTTVSSTGLAAGFTASFDPTNGTVTVIPEPRAALIGGLGMLALLSRRRSA
jgi:fibronectin-binding autotransporter adhesin